jgi:hypothetical protein
VTNKQKIEILRQYTDLIVELDTLMESYLFLRTKLMSPNIPQLKQDPVQCSMTDSQSAALADMIDLENVINARKMDVINARRKIERAVRGVQSSTHRQLLMLKYYNNMKWESICVEMSYSWKQIHRLHSDALNEIEFYQFKNSKIG